MQHSSFDPLPSFIPKRARPAWGPGLVLAVVMPALAAQESPAPREAAQIEALEQEILAKVAYTEILSQVARAQMVIAQTDTEERPPAVKSPGSGAAGAVAAAKKTAPAKPVAKKAPAPAPVATSPSPVVSAHPDALVAVDPVEEKRKSGLGRFFGKIFGSRKPESPLPPPPAPVAQQHDQKIKEYFPHGPDASVKISKYEKAGDDAVAYIFDEMLRQTERFTAPELDHARLSKLPPVPQNFDASWKSGMRERIWKDQPSFRYGVDKAYATALNNSAHVRSFLRLPRIRDAVVRENRGLFDTQIFAEADAAHDDQPTGSILTTGQTGRFLQDSYEGEYGVRQRLGTGGEISLSHRMSTLKNNSEFLDPNPQTGSELVLSVAQPLLRGAGSTYVHSEIRLAELDRSLAQGETLRLLEEYLLEVNRSYWGVYLSRAALAQRQQLTQQTSELLKTLEERQKLDESATLSELFRATATMNRREADLRRTQMAVRTSEQRLRAMIKDPTVPMGASGEIIPVSAPHLGQPGLDIQSVSKEALLNRPEMAQASARVRAAAVRRSQVVSELRPQLDLVGEVGSAGISGGRSVGSAIDDQTSSGADWRVGLRFSYPLGNSAAKARLERRDIEIQQAMDDYRIQGENVLLQTLVAYQDLLTAYQDMAGKYQSALASRREIQQLQDRMKLADQDAGKSMAYQVQLLLDAIDRNQVAEEEFLVAVVAYNTSIAQLQRAQGVLLKVKDVVPLHHGPQSAPGSANPQLPPGLVLKSK